MDQDSCIIPTVDTTKVAVFAATYDDDKQAPKIKGTWDDLQYFDRAVELSNFCESHARFILQWC